MTATDTGFATAEILSALNDAQREAVTWRGGNRLVLAGAGSGKTRVLTHRLAWLHAEQDVRLPAIMMVTFTNKAAKEMNQRAQAMLGAPMRLRWVGTFHGLSLQMLRFHAEAAGLAGDFQVIDGDDQRRIVKTLCQALGMDTTDRTLLRAVSHFINRHKEQGWRAGAPALAAETERNPRDKHFLEVYQRYEAHCREIQVVDFAELLLRSLEMLRAPNSPVLARYREQFEHILVDEFQDTNAVQYQWLQCLAGAAAEVMAVGDDDQSIYGWRGARVENIQRFTQDFANVQTVRLEQNYRSTQPILDVANHIIRSNQNRLGKNMWTERKTGEPVELFSAYNDREEADFFRSRVQEWAAAGNDYQQTAVLYRTHAQSRSLEEALLRAAIPYRIYGGLRFYQRREIREALAYLRLIVNPNDTVAFGRVINTPVRGIGPAALQRLREHSNQHGGSLWDAAVAGADRHKGLRDFVERVEKLRDSAQDASLRDIAETVINDSGLVAMFKKDHTESGSSRLENLSELVSACEQFAETLSAEEAINGADSEPPRTRELAEGAPDGGRVPSELERFLDRAIIDSGDEGSETDSVQLMTLHAAKGLEFDQVFVVGLEDNLLPTSGAKEDPAQLAEERRLLYVGMTRARRRLCLCWAQRRMLHGTVRWNQPSPFLRNLPRSLIKELRSDGGADLQPARRPASMRAFDNVGEVGAVDDADSSIAAADGDGDVNGQNPISQGQRVYHQRFGEGTVTGSAGEGRHLQLHVHFDRAGHKWLVASHANLATL